MKVFHINSWKYFLLFKCFKFNYPFRIRAINEIKFILYTVLSITFLSKKQMISTFSPTQNSLVNENIFFKF